MSLHFCTVTDLTTLIRMWKAYYDVASAPVTSDKRFGRVLRTNSEGFGWRLRNLHSVTHSIFDPRNLKKYLWSWIWLLRILNSDLRNALTTRIANTKCTRHLMQESSSQTCAGCRGDPIQPESEALKVKTFFESLQSCYTYAWKYESLDIHLSLRPRVPFGGFFSWNARILILILIM